MCFHFFDISLVSFALLCRFQLLPWKNVLFLRSVVNEGKFNVIITQVYSAGEVHSSTGLAF